MNGKETNDVVKGLAKYGGGSVGIIGIIYIIIQALLAPIKTDISAIKMEITKINKTLECVPVLTFKQKILWKQYEKEIEEKSKNQ